MFGSPNWTRTSDTLINSQVLYRLSYGGIWIRKQYSRCTTYRFCPKTNERLEPMSNLRRFVLANTYLPGPSPAKYFRHDRA